MTATRTALFVDHAAALGGAEISLLTLMAALDRDRWRPVLATVPGRLAAEAERLAIPVRFLPLARLQADGGSRTARSARAPRTLWRLARGAWSLARLARAERADLLQANVLRAAIYTLPAARLAGKPWVWHVRDILGSTTSSRLLCREAAAVIAISRAVAAALPCAARAQVIPNPVAVTASTGVDRRSLGLPDGQLVASVGRLRPWKGHHRFVEMAAQVAAPDARFLIIGGRDLGEDREDLAYGESLRRQADALGLGDRLTLLGDRGDLAEIWPHLSVLVHAADAEPFGRVLAEAQLAGVPVVAFADGGVPEVVQDQVTGILTPAGDSQALADAVARLLADAQLAGRLGAAGRRLATDRFDPAAHARAVERVFDRVG